MGEKAALKRELGLIEFTPGRVQFNKMHAKTKIGINEYLTGDKLNGQDDTCDAPVL